MNIEPLKSFLEEEISPADLAMLIDDFLFDYIERLLKYYSLDAEIGLAVDTANFIHCLKRLRDVLNGCR